MKKILLCAALFASATLLEAQAAQAESTLLDKQKTAQAMVEKLREHKTERPDRSIGGADFFDYTAVINKPSQSEQPKEIESLTPMDVQELIKQRKRLKSDLWTIALEHKVATPEFGNVTPLEYLQKSGITDLENSANALKIKYLLTRPADKIAQLLKDPSSPLYGFDINTIFTNWYTNRKSTALDQAIDTGLHLWARAEPKIVEELLKLGAKTARGSNQIALEAIQNNLKSQTTEDKYLAEDIAALEKHIESLLRLEAKSENEEQNLKEMQERFDWMLAGQQDIKAQIDYLEKIAALLKQYSSN